MHGAQVAVALVVDCRLCLPPHNGSRHSCVELENNGCRWRFEDGAGSAFLKVQVLPAQLVLE